jgi:hypothetical protein
MRRYEQCMAHYGSLEFIVFRDGVAHGGHCHRQPGAERRRAHPRIDLAIGPGDLLKTGMSSSTEDVGQV